MGYGRDNRIRPEVLEEIGGDNVLVMNRSDTGDSGYKQYVPQVQEMVCSKYLFLFKLKNGSTIFDTTNIYSLILLRLIIYLDDFKGLFLRLMTSPSLNKATKHNRTVFSVVLANALRTKNAYNFILVLTTTCLLKRRIDYCSNESSRPDQIVTIRQDYVSLLQATRLPIK